MARRRWLGKGNGAVWADESRCVAVNAACAAMRTLSGEVRAGLPTTTP